MASHLRKRFGLDNFFHRLSLASAASSSPGGSSRSRRGCNALNPGSLGCADLPKTIKAVCMLYCFTIGTLKEIRNDILAGNHILIRG
ncbi:unnamed protein product [Protopolystoma xenopodis]|uniref:Uncharacterized protein n=1 Tax=Protopolystoma xenopodis TaxID=117903 RepID=A0A3S5CJH7_9PLAT|nr:unnamed protein product [Protopolystoma xenopodis]